MSYQPTYEDAMYLMKNEWRVFDRDYAFDEIVSIARKRHNGEPVDESDVTERVYQAYLDAGAEPLTESPLPPGTVLAEDDVYRMMMDPADIPEAYAAGSAPHHAEGNGDSRQDPVMGGACVECASLTPCIEKVEVLCHEGANARVTLQGERELVDYQGCIFFVAERFVTGDGTLEDFLGGTQLKDEGTVAITLADDCHHGQHTVNWTTELSGIALPPGTTTTLNFTVMTRPISPITLPNILMGLIPPDAELVFKLAVLLLNILMKRDEMIHRQHFNISYDGTNDFSFTSVTLPQLKLDGLITIAPPSIDTRPVEKQEGRMAAAELSMGSRVRQVTQRQGWGFHAGMTAVCGADNRTITLGTSPSQTTTYDTGPSLRQAENQRQQQSTIERFIDTLSSASQRIAQNLSATESDRSKLFSFYTRGPELMLGATSEQVEESGGPGTSWRITPGLSLAYECGIRLDIYAALKIAARGTGGGTALVKFLDNLEEGFDWYFAEGRVEAALFMEVGLGVGPEPTEETLGNHMLRYAYDFQNGELSSGGMEGGVSITLKALVAGGLLGYFDSLFTERTVFKYGVEVSTSGSITLTSDELGRWGYQLSHTGAMLRVQGYKKADGDTVNSRQPGAGGRPNANHQIQRSASQVVETEDGTRWQEDGQVLGYRLAEGWTGEFHPF
ncbi:hypothetical protein [Halomonas dongshanensis]|uniref:Uncharacterized protein n=1 Tax=Halomonas dongshanensis TaxID=2890835 RepID=A0ABT2ECH5_9GAMM|nr:hypothetical protein [Halomonas dongshanensis]MCS2609269.1 hypothetical protein [Halomonas dongshanensis]